MGVAIACHSNTKARCSLWSNGLFIFLPPCEMVMPKTRPSPHHWCINNENDVRRDIATLKVGCRMVSIDTLTLQRVIIRLFLLLVVWRSTLHHPSCIGKDHRDRSKSVSLPCTDNLAVFYTNNHYTTQLPTHVEQSAFSERICLASGNCPSLRSMILKLYIMMPISPA